MCAYTRVKGPLSSPGIVRVGNRCLPPLPMLHPAAKHYHDDTTVELSAWPILTATAIAACYKPWRLLSLWPRWVLLQSYQVICVPPSQSLLHLFSFCLPHSLEYPGPLSFYFHLRRSTSRSRAIETIRRSFIALPSRLLARNFNMILLSQHDLPFNTSKISQNWSPELLVCVSYLS